MAIAKSLIDFAVEAKCNAVKFQKREIDKVYEEKYLRSPRESPWGSTQRAQKEGLDFGFAEYNEIDNYCKSKGIEWFASAWDIESQKFLRQFNTKYNKIASAMIIHEELLKTVALEGKHTFISTGMSNLNQIENAINIFKDHKCSFELMHTVSTYPMRKEDANLRVINTLRDKYNCNVGYSGHESGLEVSYAACAMGITSLERHITLDRNMYGSDQSASIEKDVLKKLVEGSRIIEKALGDGLKRIIKDEVEIAEKLRAHIE